MLSFRIGGGIKEWPPAPAPSPQPPKLPFWDTVQVEDFSSVSLGSSSQTRNWKLLNLTERLRLLGGNWELAW